MPITRNTPFRDVGPVPFAVWNNTVSRYGGRGALGTEAAWKAAGTLSAVLLRILIQESSVDTDYKWNSKANNNPYNIRVKGYANEGKPEGYIKFDNLVAATKAAAERIDGAAGYFDGPNPYASCVTIADVLTTYAPPKWNDTEGLITKMVDQLNVWLPNWSPPVYVPSTGEEPVEQEPSVAVTFGKVPKPPSQNRYIPSRNNTAWNDLGKRLAVPNAFVLHRMEGSLNGTDEYFNDMPNARQTGNGGLTNIGVGVAAMDGNALAGVIYEWNTPELDSENRAGWANGRVSGAYGDGAKYVDRFGIDAVNRDTESCEISGQLSTPLDEASRTAIAARLAWRADQYGAELAKKGEQFDYSTFPYIPSQSRNFTIWHQEFTIGTGKTCPGPVVMQETAALIARAKVILEKYQTGSVTPQPEPEPVYAAAAPIPAGSQNLNGYIFLAPGGKTVQADTYPFVYADKNSVPTGPKLKKGTKITQDQIQQYVQGSDGAIWVVLVGVPGVKDFSRFPAASLIKDAA